MDQFKLMLLFIYAVKAHERELFHYCNGKMAILFFAYDGHNYSCYFTWFEAFAINLELIHSGAMKFILTGALGYARSLIPVSLCAVDKTMEETFMKFAKGSGRLLGIFEQYGAYQRRCRTTFERACYYEQALEMCGLLDDPEVPKEGRHKKLQQSQIKKSEAAVLKVVSAIQSFTNRWRVFDRNRLYSLSSRLAVGIDVENDVLGTEDHLLFNIDLFDLFYECEESNIASYADGTTPYSCARNTQIVISELKSISSKLFHWFQYNHLKANPGNYRLLLSSKTPTDVSIGDVSIKTSTKETLLGILIDSELSFDHHISSICTKANKKIHTPGHIATFMPFNKLRALMKAFIESQFDYFP